VDADALSAWKRFRDATLAGTTTESPTFQQFVDRYWTLVAGRVSTKTAREQRYHVQNLLLPFFGPTRLDRSNAALVQDFLGTLKGHGYAPASINGIMAVLSKLLHDAVERDILDRLPVKGGSPKVTVPRLRLELTNDERERFLHTFDNPTGFQEYLRRLRTPGTLISSPRYRAPRSFGASITPDGPAARIHFERFHHAKPLFVVALETGLRRGDLLHLRWSSIDLAAKWVRATLQKRDAKQSSRSARPARTPSKRARSTPGSPCVFLTFEGEPYSETTLRQYFRLAKTIAGITRRCRFHDLRHTFGSDLATAGVSLQVIAQAMGHTTTRMTEIYAKPAAAAMNAIRHAL
jgi:integrase